MDRKFNVLTLTFLLFTTFIIRVNDTQAQTEGFNVKTPTQKIADSSENFVRELIKGVQRNHKDALPKDLICGSKCIAVLPLVKAVNERNDFEGSGLLTCLKINSDELTPPIFYEINELTSFYETDGSIVVFVTDDTGVKSVLVNSIELTSDNSEPGKTGADTEFKSGKPFISYAKPVDQNVEGYELSGSKLVYANKDTFKAYQKTMVPIDILLDDQDIPPELRGFNSAVKEFRAICK